MNTNVILPTEPNGTIFLKSEIVTEWHALFEEAEKRIKEIEHDNEGLDIPAVNELRYVAYHILQALMAKNQATKDEECRRALSHLHRSIYDACEALISIQLTQLLKFQSDYQLVPVSTVVKNYQELMEKAESASSLIKGTHRGHDDREKYYGKALEYASQLREINGILRASRDELNKQLAIERRNSRRWVIGAILTGTGIIAATIVGVAKFLS